MKQSETQNALYAAEVKEQQAARAETLGRYEEAASRLNEALRLKESELGPNAAAVAETHFALGRLDLLQKSYPAAEEQFKKAQTMLEAAYYPEHAKVGPVVEHLAECYLAQGRLEEAEPLLKKALEIHQKTSRADRPDILHVTGRLIHLYEKTGKWTDAEALLKKAVTAADTPWGPVEDFLYDQAITFQELGKNEDAEKSFKRSVDAYRQRAKWRGLEQVLRAYADFLKKLGRTQESDQLVAEAESLAGNIGSQTGLS
jgi:tetratricopeptide (TPR) repeat protein